jgi:hypothetical protein
MSERAASAVGEETDSDREQGEDGNHPRGTLNLSGRQQSARQSETTRFLRNQNIKFVFGLYSELCLHFNCM